MEKKMRVVILCHYWSEEVTTMMSCSHRKDLSPWIQETLNLFKDKNEVELHVVAPNYNSNTDRFFFQNNISYHFFNYAIKWIAKIFYPLVRLFIRHDEPSKIAERIANILTFYQFPKYRIKRIIEKINPDVIYLSGSENPDYCVGAISLRNKFPILLSIQGYAYMQNEPKIFLEKINHYQRIKFEYKINWNAKYVSDFSMEEGFKPFLNKQNFYSLYPVSKNPNILADSTEKEYDLVFYARVVPEKGIEDLILAISKLNSNGNKLRTIIIGKSDYKYLDFLKKLIKQNKVDELITFTGFIQDPKEVYKLASKAKIMVLPTYNDGFNNSIREAMFMKLPVIASNIGGIPIANKHQECITLSEVGNITDIAEKIELVLNDKIRTERLVKNAHDEMNNRYSIDKVYPNLLDTFQKVLDDYSKL